MKNCIKCQVELTHINWRTANKNKKYYICNICSNKISSNATKNTRNNQVKMAEIYSEHHICYKCKIKLTIDNWKKERAAKKQCLCDDCNRKNKNEENKKSKIQALNAYGNKCNCCGIDNSVFLTIDHISNDGNKERKLLNIKTGSSMYRYLRREKYPKENYQILCFNCNFAKHLLGVCPHQQPA